ncbi:MAG: hypothetical protein IJA14_01395 [Alphaproteobacteria bacterium]|nr:hypothetical protein [Alphaproteobacteria bacterium]
MLFVSFESDGIYLNGLKVIDQKSRIQIAVLKILLERHFFGYINGTHSGVNALQLSDVLRKKGFLSIESEKHVRQLIYRIKKNVSEKFGKEISNDFIKSSQNFGQYRLGKNVVLICS